MELDTHADTNVLGSNCIVIAYTTRECDVSPYTDTYQAIRNVPIVTGATAWTSQHSGETYILVFHEALWMGEVLDHSLINPNQLRHFGVSVQDNPYADTELHIDTNDNLILPLHNKGTTIYFDSRTPTDHELQTCRHVHLTSKAEWNPHHLSFPEPSHQVDISDIQSSRTEHNTDVDDHLVLLDPHKFADRLISRVLINDDRMHSAISDVRVDNVPSDVPLRRTFISNERHSALSAAELSERWGIGLVQATNTIKVTTQHGKRSAILPLSRRYKADRAFERPFLRGHFYTDTVDARCKSIDGNSYAQLFATKDLFVAVYPIATKSLAGEGLRQFIHDYGRPEHLTFDGSKEQTGKNTEFMRNISKYSIAHKVTEPDRPNHNHAEGVVREVRKKWFRIMMKKKVPSRLWDYGFRWVCEIQNRTSNSARGLNGRCPLEKITGESVDITEYLDFGFFDWIWFKDNAGLGQTKLGRWLVGPLMSYWVLSRDGQIMSRTTVQRVTNLELTTAENVARITEFNTLIASKVGDPTQFINEGKTHPADWAGPDDFDDDFQAEFTMASDSMKDGDTDIDYTPDIMDDTYLHMELALPRGGGEVEFARVKKRLRDKDGLPIGTANDNPILDSRMYEVEFPDGYTTSLSANVIAENLFSQVDPEGHRHSAFDDIIDYRTNDQALSIEDSTILTPSGTTHKKQTTAGWDLLIQWKDGSTTWVTLKEAKNSYPVQVAEYAVAMALDSQPAFAWWVPFTLRKRNQIISKVKSKYWIRTHKFGIKIPKNVHEALEIDRENGDTLWWDAICKEMKNVRPAFEAWDKSVSEIPIGYQEVRCHLIFDVKMGENFRRKARFVAGGHTTDVPSTLTYASVVSRDSVRIALTVAALNDLQIMACDIQNAYLTADCREKIWTRAGPEFGSEAGSIFMVKKALYGLKSAGAAFRALLAETLYDIGYVPTRADPDVWIRPAIKPDGFEYYEMVLCYVDDVLSVSHDPRATLQGLQSTFKLKDDKIEKPDMYLGASLETMQVDGHECWTASAEKYVASAIKNVEEVLAKKGQRLPTKCYSPLPTDYHPELEASAELKAEGIQYYQELIGVLRWAVELGRVDIHVEVALMSSQMALPRVGHLEHLSRIFGYLKHKPKRKLAFDAQHPKIDERRFKQHDWFDFYRDAKEAIPDDMPTPRGNYMSTHCFVDASHGSDHATRRSQTGILIFCNRAPILWHSKKQNTVEASTFGSEFQAMKNAVELVESLRYKLRMFGIPIEGPTNVFCDNDAVCKNTTSPDSTLKKKHHSIAYHRCREAVAAGTIRIAKEDTKTNLSDLFTKILPPPRREELLNKFTY